MSPDFITVADYDGHGCPDGRKEFHTGTTLGPVGWVYAAIYEYDPEHARVSHSVAHLSPYRARTLAFDLLDAADNAEQELLRAARRGDSNSESDSHIILGTN